MEIWRSQTICEKYQEQANIGVNIINIIYKYKYMNIYVDICILVCVKYARHSKYYA